MYDWRGSSGVANTRQREHRSNISIGELTHRFRTANFSAKTFNLAYLLTVPRTKHNATVASWRVKSFIRIDRSYSDRWKFSHKLAVIRREYADWGGNKYANLGCYNSDM